MKFLLYFNFFASWLVIVLIVWDTFQWSRYTEALDLHLLINFKICFILFKGNQIKTKIYLWIN